MSRALSSCTVLSTKLKPLSVAIFMALSTTGAEAVTFSFRDNTATDVVGSGSHYAACNIDFTAGAEFRMCQPNNTSLGGGIPLQKSMIDGVELWDFDDSTGLMTGVTNTPYIGNCIYTICPLLLSLSPPFEGFGIDQGANLLTAHFGFLAPTLGSEAGNFYGAGQYTVTGADTFEVFFPTLEGQWSGVYFPLGLDGNKGVTFFGTTDGTNFSMWAEHTFTTLEDPVGAGFYAWTTQWYYTGTITGFVPPSANSPSSDIGIFDGRRISLAEAQAIGGVDTEMSEACVGGCFDFSVTNLAAGASVKCTLPLTDEIPVRAVYRMFDGTAWRNFITDANNFIESGKTATSPVDCSEVKWTPGLTPGHHNCVRLTMNEGGPNDLDGLADGVLTDLGGVAQVPPILFNRSSDGGCSLSSQPVSATNRADWWIVGMFLAILGLRRKLHKQQKHKYLI